MIICMSQQREIAAAAAELSSSTSIGSRANAAGRLQLFHVQIWIASNLDRDHMHVFRRLSIAAAVDAYVFAMIKNSKFKLIPSSSAV